MFGAPELSIKEILKRTTKQDLLNYYIPENETDGGGKINCPFHQDDTPSLHVYRDSGRFICYGCGETGDAINYIRRKFSLNFDEALRVINRDFNLGLGGNAIVASSMTLEQLGLPRIKEYKKAKSCVIHIKRRSWNYEDEAYWKKRYGLTTSILYKYRVFPLSHFWIDGKCFACRKQLTYAYLLGEGKYKLYSPLSEKKVKWFSNVTPENIQGWNQLPKNGEVCIITKSLKDVMIYHLLDLPAVAPIAESAIIPSYIIEELKSRFNKILVNYDFDRAGIVSANRLRKTHSIVPFFLTNGAYNSFDFEAKDVSDYVERFGIDKLKELFNQNSKRYV